jgi:hypothetical protein
MAREENEFLRTRGFAEYAAWYLGINEEQPEDTKDGTNSPSEISNMSIAAAYSPPRAALANTSISASKTRQRTYTE